MVIYIYLHGISIDTINNNYTNIIPIQRYVTPYINNVN